jgi:hypothetical protein
MLSENMGSTNNGVLPELIFPVFVLSGRERDALRGSKPFFDNSEARLRFSCRLNVTTFLLDFYVGCANQTMEGGDV